MFAVVLLFSIAFGIEDNGTYIEPDCRYAASAGRYYPIGACESDRVIWGNETYEYSFRYICDESNQVLKEKFDELWCSGNGTIMNATEIDHYECDVTVTPYDCSYATVCSLGACNAVNQSNCDLCMDAEDDMDMLLEGRQLQCTPYITGECIGSEGFLEYVTCENDLAVIGYYFGANCSGDADWEIRDGGANPNDTCKLDWYSGEYYAISAECNYQMTTMDPTTTVMEETEEMMSTEMNETVIEEMSTEDMASTMGEDPCADDPHAAGCPDHDHDDGDMANRFGVAMAVWVVVMAMLKY